MWWIDWARHRLEVASLVPAVGLLTGAAVLGPWRGPTRMLGVALFCGTAFVALRFWDDVEDRHQDAQHHPDRVLHRVNPAVLMASLVALLASALALGWGLSPTTCTGFLGLVMGLGLFYRTRGPRWPAAVVLKYPMLVGVVRLSADGLTVALMLLVLIGIWLDEFPEAAEWGVVGIGAATVVVSFCVPGWFVLALYAWGALAAGLRSRRRLGRVGLAIWTCGVLVLTQAGYGWTP